MVTDELLSLIPFQKYTLGGAHLVHVAWRRGGTCDTAFVPASSLQCGHPPMLVCRTGLPAGCFLIFFLQNCKRPRC